MTKDPYRYFRIEAKELLDQLGAGIVELERTPARELATRLLRLAHTLKGAARVVKQPEIAEAAHAIEDAIDPGRGGEPVPRAGVEVVLAALDRIAARVAALGTGDAPTAAPGAEAAPAPGSAPGSASASASGSAPGPASVPASAAVLAPIAAATADIDELLTAVAEAHAQLAPLRAIGGAALVHVEQLERELAAVRDAAERIRLVPVSTLFAGLSRVARDAAQALGRRVAVDGDGGESRLDGTVLAAIQAALIQVVRNAVAHGIEPPAEREATGKPATGRIAIAVTRRGTRIRVTCTDDGRGIDVEAVRAAAERRGVPRGEAAELGADELIRLLLGGGISTATGITSVAGRGIGLDVVRDAVARVNGRVRIETAPGRGTTVELDVPATVASMPALIVVAGDRVATIPLAAITDAMRLRPDELVTTATGEVVTVRGAVVPFVPLARVLGGRSDGASRARPWSAVVVRGATGVAAVGVDRVLGQATIVVRPLPALAPAATVVAGASLDAQGDPLLSLDPDALVAAAATVAATPPAVEPARNPILVIDDSLTTRMLVQSILESAGYLVETASSAEQGLDQARTRDYSLFLVDVEMPGMDGFAFIERASADARLRLVPAILLTSRSSPEDRRRGEQVGARAYVVKGEFDQRQLLDRIGRLVG